MKTIRNTLKSCLCMMLIMMTMLSITTDAFALDKNLFKTEYSAYLRKNGLTQTGNGATDILRAAMAMKGKSGKKVGSKGAWCASFVSCCAETVGQSKAIPYNTGVKAICTKIKQAGGKVIYNKGSSGSLKNAKPGDIVAYNDWGHVEIVTAVIRNGKGSVTGIKSIGGNTGSGSSHSSRTVKEHTWSNGKVRYIIRPNYSYAAPPATASSQTPANGTTPAQTQSNANAPQSSGTTQPIANYMDSCRRTDTYLTLTAANSSDSIMTLPCSSGTDSRSKAVRRLIKGEALTALAIYQNSAGNYWYQVKASDGKSGYIFGGCAAVTGVPEDAISGNAKLATTSPKLGKAVRISGTLKAITLKIEKVTGVLTGSKNSKQTQTVNVNGTSFDIQPTAINKNLKFGKLKAGAGNLRLTVTLIGQATNGSAVYDQTVSVTLPQVNFTVKK